MQFLSNPAQGNGVVSAARNFVANQSSLGQANVSYCFVHEICVTVERKSVDDHLRIEQSWLQMEYTKYLQLRVNSRQSSVAFTYSWNR